MMMSSRIKLALAWLLFVCGQASSSRLDGIGCSYPKERDRKLVGHVFSEFREDIESMCYRLCWIASRCMSFNWNYDRKICQLNDAVGSDFALDLIMASGFTYGIVEQEFCQESSHPCHNRVCPSNSVCVSVLGGKDFICLHNATTTTTPSTTTFTTLSTSTTTTTHSTSTETTSSTSTTTTTPSTSTTTTTPSTSTTTTTPSTFTTTATTSSATLSPTTTTGATVGGVPYTFVGCYSFSPHNDFLRNNEVSDNSLTHATCASHCDGNSQTYFGVEKGKNCFCDVGLELSGHTKLEDGDCDLTPCKGDSAPYCGAPWKLAVFLT